MEAKLHFKMKHCATVTAVGYHPLRREAITGHRDGMFFCWRTSDSETPLLKRDNHKGRTVTSFCFWEAEQSFFSCSLDGSILQWNTTFMLLKEVNASRAIHSLCWFSYKPSDKEFLILGLADSIGVIKQAKYTSYSSQKTLQNTVHKVTEGHSDMVYCIKTFGNKLFTAGYDKCICVYELAHHHASLEEKAAKKNIFNLLHMVRNAHDAAITCLELGSDVFGTITIYTGSYDQRVKSWTTGLCYINSIHLPGTVTGIGLMKQTGILWVAADNKKAMHFEPKTCENISAYLEQATHSISVPERRSSSSAKSLQQSKLKFLKYIAESGEIIGVTDTRELIVSKYSKTRCICVQTCTHPLLCIAYTNVTPILFFTGSANAEMTKWERLQLNHYKYKQEDFYYIEELRTHLKTDLGSSNLAYFLHGSSKDPFMELGYKDMDRARAEAMKMDNREFVKAVYVEKLELLVASARDGRIIVWGFDEKAIEALTKMESKTSRFAPSKVSAEDMLTYKRVAGFEVRFIMTRHCGPVSGLTVAPVPNKPNIPCLVSASWDLTICAWNLENGRMFTQLKNAIPASDDCYDLLITDLAYSSSQNLMAYSATNHKIYLRNFHFSQFKMTLIRTLEGHDSEVTQVCWNPCTNTWVSGSDNGQLRVWSADGSECVKMLSSDAGEVTVLKVDPDNSVILACMKKTLKVFNNNLDVLAVYQGHTNIIRDLIVIPELEQYVTVSQDCTMRIWQAYS